MINILYTINFLTNGGPTRVLQNIIKNINLNKYKVTILTLINENNKNIVANFKNNGITILELNYNKSLKKILKNKNIILNTINEIHPDIIHTHGIVSTFIISNKNIKSLKLTTIHNNMFEDYKYTYGKIKGIIFSVMHIMFLKKFDLSICCSKTSYDILKKYVKHITYIRNGIDIPKKKNINNIRQSIRKQLNIPTSGIIFVYGGVINSRKRVVQLVKKFKEIHAKDEYLLIVGDGPLMKEAKIYKDDNIIFTGFKTNILDYFYASDVYVSNSSAEGFSISIIEALSCGLLCLLSNIPSHKECFEIDNNYYLGESFNQINFCDQKNKIRDKLKTINKKNIVLFQDKYLSSKSMAEKYIEIYEKRTNK